MNDFFPYIHQIKKQDEPEQLQIELEPPPPLQKQERVEESYIVVIELF